MIKLLPYDLKVMGSSQKITSCNASKVVYNKFNVVGPFLEFVLTEASCALGCLYIYINPPITK